MFQPGALRPALALVVVALAAPACGLIAGLGDYQLTSGTGGATGSSSGNSGNGGSSNVTSTGTGVGGSSGLVTGTRISGGTYHVCAIADGTDALRCWGANSDGQLGVGPDVTGMADTAKAVPGVPTAKQIAAGISHTCAVLADTTVTCWGNDADDAVGVPNTPGILGAQALTIHAAHIAAGYGFTCVITPDEEGSEVKCWGNGLQGSLGSAIDKTATPGPTQDPIKGATAIATCAGCGTACALVGSEVRCWGGDMGDFAPIAITDATDTVAVAVGNSESSPTVQGEMVFVLSKQGALRYTRRDDNGAWKPLTDYATDIAQIAVGNHIAAVTTKKKGLHSDSFTAKMPPPPLDIPLDAPSEILEIAAGVDYDCVRTTSGVLCTGNDSFGQLGDGHAEVVPRAVKVASNISAMFAGGDCTTLKRTDTSMFDAFGQCQVYDGNGGGPRIVPSGVGQLAPSVQFLRTGTSASTTFVADRRGYFLDSANTLSELFEKAKVTPLDITLTAGLTDVQLTANWDLALQTDGVLRLTALTSPPDSPNKYKLFGNVAVSKGTSVTFSPYQGFAATNGAEHVCAWTSAGALSCWGDNSLMQSNPLVTDGQPVAAPVPVLDLVSTAVVGAAHTCALRNNGRVYCWGDNHLDQLGNDNPTFLPDGTYKVPMPTLSTVTLLAGGLAFTCAYVDADQAVYCWGDNQYGECGSGLLQTPSPPQPVAGLTGKVLQLAATHEAMCARMDTNDVYCWGNSQGGQVGNGGHQGVSELQPVVGL